MSKKIESVFVYIDKNMPEYMQGVIRCGQCDVTYSDGEVSYVDEVVDNSEYHSINDMCADIANRLEVSLDIVEIGV